MSEVVKLRPLISEAEAYERYGHVLQDRELRQARKSGLIGYYVRRRRVLYREDELVEFVNAKLEGSYVEPCPKKKPENPSSDSDATGSTRSKDQPGSTVSGMTPELEKSAAALLRQQTSKTPRSSSRPSSSKKAPLRLVSPKT